MKKFKLGDYVEKTYGFKWVGYIVGEYSTKRIPEGYVVETDEDYVNMYSAEDLKLATPPQRKPLTDDEIDGLMADTWGGASIAPQSAPAFARAIERAHGIIDPQINATDFGVSPLFAEEAEHFARWAIAKEREACANIVKDECLGFNDDDEQLNRIAKAIRARGNK
jgi:hypothetical protein